MSRNGLNIQVITDITHRVRSGIDFVSSDSGRSWRRAAAALNRVPVGSFPEGTLIGCHHSDYMQETKTQRFSSATPNEANVCKSDTPVQIPMAGGTAASSKGPAFHLIPTIALIEIANRFEKGVERKKDKAWNATSQNQECLLDKEFAIERISHVIHHAMKLRDQLVSGVKPRDESMVDNASAVAWGGVFSICAVDAMSTQEE